MPGDRRHVSGILTFLGFARVSGWRDEVSGRLFVRGTYTPYEMQVGSSTDHDSEFWGGVRRTMRRQTQNSLHGARVSSGCTIENQAAEVHPSVELVMAD